MKKTYQKPSVNNTIDYTTQLLADSRLDKNDTGADPDVVLSRQDKGWGNTWDESEDD